ncbi:MAG: type VI secretion system tip protein TssI/VgrG [Pseudomonadota bacterium]
MPFFSSELFGFSLQGFPPGCFGVLAFQGKEGLSRCYEFTITLISEDTDLDLERALEAPASFSLNKDGREEWFHGVLTSIEELSVQQDYAFFRATLEPRLKLLNLVQNSRLFMDLSTPQIVMAVLREQGFSSSDFEFKLARDYPTWEYLCQFNESNYNFVMRLLEREGIYFFFEQNENSEKAIFTDSKISHVDSLSGGPVQYSPDPGLGAVREDDLIRSFTCRHRMTPRTVQLMDYNYRAPNLSLASRSDVAPDGRGAVLLYGEHYKTPEEGDILSRVRAEQLACQKIKYQGKSRSTRLKPGVIFNLQGHFREEMNGPFLVEEITHKGEQSGNLTAGLRPPSRPSPAGQIFYRNKFTAIPASVQFRPPRKTPKPRISGTMNAHVDASGPEKYAELDEQGRYRVRLPFDLAGRAGGKASRPMRMVQPYGGPDYGFHFPLHKGCEVLLTFIEGDPDRPIIASAAPNPENPSPVNDQNATKSVLHTAGGAKIEMEDLEGNERLLLYSPKSNSFIRLGSRNDPGDAAEPGTSEEHEEEKEDEKEKDESGFAWSTEGDAGLSSRGFDLKVWGNESEMTAGFSEQVISPLFCYFVGGVEFNTVLGGRFGLFWPKSKLAFRLERGNILEKKIRVIEQHVKALEKQLKVTDSVILAVNNSVDVISKEISLAQTELVAVNDNIGQANAVVHSIGKRTTVLDGQNTTMGQQITRAQTVLESAGTTIVNSGTAISNLEQSVNQTRVLNQQLGTRVNEVPVQNSVILNDQNN